MRFDKLNISPEIKTNLEKAGFFRTTDIQYKTIPAILNGEDVLAIAQTGTGKTAAFAIPIIDQIHSEKTSRRTDGIRCIVLVPTRELAKQIGLVFTQLADHTRASSFAIYGGVDQDPQIGKLTAGVDILISTPGRMFDLIHQKYIDVSAVRVLVLDEADHMLDLGFIDAIISVKSKLKQRHQTLFFSATINPTIKKLAYSQVKSNALRIQVSPEKLVSRNVTHYLARVDMDHKRHLLVHFLRTNADAKAIVFVRTQVRAERVLAQLGKHAVTAVSLHGGMDQTKREDALEAFRRQTNGALVATDVTARGIDLPGITHVINYDLPDHPENYVHRVGRTGRGFAKGYAVSFYSPEEADKLQLIEKFLQTEIVELKVDGQYLEDPAEKKPEVSVSDMLAMAEAQFTSRRTKKKSR